MVTLHQITKFKSTFLQKWFRAQLANFNYTNISTNISGYKYRISSKSHCGEILFQGPVWCGDNSRAVSTEIDTHAHTQIQ